MNIIEYNVMHTRSFQIFLDITRNCQLLVPFDYQHAFFPKKFWHIKQLAGYLFCTGRTATLDDTRYFQISRLISSATCTFLIINTLYFFRILAYKTSSWVFISNKRFQLLTLKTNTLLTLI